MRIRIMGNFCKVLEEIIGKISSILGSSLIWTVLFVNNWKQWNFQLSWLLNKEVYSSYCFLVKSSLYTISEFKWSPSKVLLFTVAAAATHWRVFCLLFWHNRQYKYGIHLAD